MEMGEKIHALRIEKGLTLEQLGDKVGVGKSTVRKWENGMIANMRRDKIAKIADALGVSPGYLMGWENKIDYLCEVPGFDKPLLVETRSPSLTAAEARLVSCYRYISEEARQRIDNAIQYECDQEKKRSEV